MSSIIKKAQDVGASATARGQAALDARWAPEKRSELSESVRTWGSRNPKLFFFVALQLALTGPPLLVFLLFSVSTLLAALASCVFTAAVLALCFTGFCVGVSLLLLIPTVFITASLATVMFVGGTVTFWILKKFAESETPVPFADAIVRRIQALGNKSSATDTTGWTTEFNAGGSQRNGTNQSGVGVQSTERRDRNEIIADIKAANKLKAENNDLHAGSAVTLDGK